MVTLIGTNSIAAGAASALGVALPFPAGTQAGHLAVVNYSQERGTTPPIPSGWSTILATSNGTLATVVQIYKVLDAADISTGSVTLNAGIGRFYASIIAVFADAGTPVAASSGYVVGNSSATTAVGPAVTASDATGLLVSLFAFTRRTSPYTLSVTPGSDWTEQREATSGSTTSINAVSHVATKANPGSGSRAGQTVTTSSGDFAYWATTLHLPHQATNYAPIVTPAASITNAEPASTVTTSVTATDSDGTISTYSATAPGLTLTGSGNSRTFIAPMALTDVTYSVTWVITDNLGAQTTVIHNITVLACTTSVAQGGVRIPAIIRV